MVETTRRSLRIALNHTRLAESGGVEGYVRVLVRYLLDHGHSVDFFAGRFPYAPQHPRLRLVRVPFVRSPRPLRVWSFARFSRRCIEREHRSNAYDVVHGFSRTYTHNLYRDGSGCWDDYCEQFLSRVNRRGARSLYYRFNPIDRVIRRIERLRYVERRPRLVVAISEFVREQIIRRYAFPPERIRVVYSGVDCERFRPDLREEGRRLLAEWTGAPPQSADERRYLGFVANDFERKGLDLVLDALVDLKDAGDLPETALVVAGRDSRLDVYRERVRARGLESLVFFVGPRSDIPELLAGADALLLPSYFDAFGNIAGEALASGTPVIVSPTTGAAEWIEDGVNGWRLARTDAGALAESLRRFFATPDLESIRVAARRRAEEFRWERHFLTLEQIYEEVAGSREGL